MSIFPKINSKVPQSIFPLGNPVKSMMNTQINSETTRFLGERRAEEENTYKDLIFYPSELAKSPEYKAYTLIQLFQPETTDLESKTEEERLNESIEGLNSELGKLGAILTAGALVGYAGGGIRGLAAAMGVGVFEALSDNDKKTLIQSIEDKFKGGRLSKTRMLINAKPSFGKVKYSIGLPMPKSIKTNYGFEYEEVDFKNITTINTIADMIRVAKENKTSTPGEQEKSTNMIKDAVRTARMGATDDVMKLIPGGANFESYQDTQAGRVKAPISENIFKQVNKRSFDFSWEMIPKNRKELENIYRIIELIKLNSHPKYINGDPYYLGIPGEFLVKFYIESKENEFLPKIARLCMKGIDVDYGSDSGMSFFRQEIVESSETFANVRKGAPPTKISLTIKMEELEFLTADRILEGY
jgi:hypothetical protein